MRAELTSTGKKDESCPAEPNLQSKRDIDISKQDEQIVKRVARKSSRSKVDASDKRFSEPHAPKGTRVLSVATDGDDESVLREGSQRAVLQARRATAAKEGNTEKTMDRDDKEMQWREAKKRALLDAGASSVIDGQRSPQARRLKETDHRDQVGPEYLRKGGKRPSLKAKASSELDGTESPRIRLDNEHGHGDEDVVRTQAVKRATLTAEASSERTARRPRQEKLISKHKDQDESGGEQELNEGRRRTALAARGVNNQKGTADPTERTDDSSSDCAVTESSDDELDEDAAERARSEAKKRVHLNAKLAAEKKSGEDSIEMTAERARREREQRAILSRTAGAKQKELNEARMRPALAARMSNEQKGAADPTERTDDSVSDRVVTERVHDELDADAAERARSEAKKRAQLKAIVAAEKKLREDSVGMTAERAHREAKQKAILSRAASAEQKMDGDSAEQMQNNPEGSREERETLDAERVRKDAKKFAILKAKADAENTSREAIEKKRRIGTEETINKDPEERDKSTEERVRMAAKKAALLKNRSAAEVKYDKPIREEKIDGQKERREVEHVDRRRWNAEEEDRVEAKQKAIQRARAAATAAGANRHIDPAQTNDEPSTEAKVIADRFEQKRERERTEEERVDRRGRGDEEADRVEAKNRAIRRARAAAAAAEAKRHIDPAGTNDHTLKETNEEPAKEAKVIVDRIEQQREMKSKEEEHGDRRGQDDEEVDRLGAKKKAIIRARAAASGAKSHINPAETNEEPLKETKATMDRIEQERKRERREDEQVHRRGQRVEEMDRLEAKQKAIIRARAAGAGAKNHINPAETSDDPPKETTVLVGRTEQKRGDSRSTKVDSDTNRMADDDVTETSVVKKARQELKQVRRDKEQVLAALQAHESHERIGEDVALGRKSLKADHSGVTKGPGKDTDERDVDLVLRERSKMRRATTGRAACDERQKVAVAKWEEDIANSESNVVVEEEVVADQHGGTPADEQLIKRQGPGKQHQSADDNMKVPDLKKISREANTSPKTTAELGSDTSGASTLMTWSKCLVSLAICIGLSKFSFAYSLRLTRLDLANDLLCHLMASCDGKCDPPIPVELVLRLLTSLLTQKDIVEAMREVIGEDHSESMGKILLVREE